MDSQIKVILKSSQHGQLQSQHYCINSHLRVVSHDVIETRQEAQTGTNLDVHRTVHIVEEVQRLVDQLTALLQKTWNKETKSIFLFTQTKSHDWF